MTADEDPVVDAETPVDSDVPWRRLDRRMIWVDLAQSVLAMLPGVVGLFVVGTDAPGIVWPLVGLAVFGVGGAVADAMRWVLTRYRVTTHHVERRTGLLVRRYRSIRRDRIRSVDSHAKLRHRIAGLRVVTIGAGQQAATMESALVLDAIRADAARELRAELVGGAPRVRRADGAEGESARDDGEVFARIRYRWIWYNLLNVWSYALAAGLLWGGYWLLGAIGIDPTPWLLDALGIDGFGLTAVVTGFAAATLVGAIGMGIVFLEEHHRFELARVPSEKGSSLRTRQGLLKTREVNRDDARLRGAAISEPLAWRWMRAADTSIVTTGVNMWSLDSAAWVLPRAPRSVARQVTARILEADPNPLAAPLARHPLAALRRRLLWASAVAAAAAALLLALGRDLPLPAWAWAAWGGSWLIGLAAAVIAYRALGHAIDGDYLVLRSGLLNRSTTALQRTAVSTIVIRESLLQRRLGLRTVLAATAAGWGGYAAVDLDAGEALHFARGAAPGLLEPFCEPGEATGVSRTVS